MDYYVDRSDTILKANFVTGSDLPTEIIRVAIAKCHQSDSISDKVITGCIKAGHMSVLEHAYATFDVTCSTKTLLQLSRHRHLSLTVQSSRACDMSETSQTHSIGNADIDDINIGTIISYRDLIARGVTKEDAAYTLPQAIDYNMLVTGNYRAWYEYLQKRLCLRAQGEHRQMAQLILEGLHKHCPLIFPASTKDMLNCSKCGERSCKFN